MNVRPLGRLVVPVALSALALSSCSLLGNDPQLPAKPLEPITSSGSGSTSGPAGLARYYDQKVTWTDCRESMQCTEIEVPLDYKTPESDTVKLSVLKVPSTDKAQRIGAMLVNPGGPGGSGIQYAASAEAYFGDEVRAAFDIIGFDPRGVGSSTPIDCLSDEEMDIYIASDPDPDSAAEARAGEALLADFGEGCLDRSGELTRHVSTVEAAKDMDILRAVLDQQRMVFFGASYGTFLGATYADLFPQRVGRMVLDGAIDPSLSNVEMSLVQAEGFEVALGAYVDNCLADDSCFLGGSKDEAMTRIQDFLQGLDSDPIPGDGTRELTEGLAVLGVWAPLYDKRSWPALDVALEQALQGKGETLLSFSDQYVGRGPDGYVDNSTEALYAVNCLDHDDAVPLSDLDKYEERFVAASPTFGRIFAYGLTACGAWPVHTGTGPEVLRAQGADPILVIGTTRDPATPLAWAEALASQLESGVLISRDGDGHTGYGAGNACVDSAVEKYLVSGTVPDADLTC